MSLDNKELHKDDINNVIPPINNIISELEKTLNGEDKKIARLVQKRVKQLHTIIEMHFASLIANKEHINKAREIIRERYFPEGRGWNFNNDHVQPVRIKAKAELLRKEIDTINATNDHANNALHAVSEFIELLPTLIGQIPLGSSIRFGDKEIIDGAIDTIPLSDIYTQYEILYPTHYYAGGGESYKLNVFTNTLNSTALHYQNNIDQLEHTAYQYINTIKNNVIVGTEKEKIHSKCDTLDSKIEINNKTTVSKEYTILGKELLKILQQTDWVKLAQEEKDFRYNHHTTHQSMPLPQSINLLGYIHGFLKRREESIPKYSLQSKTDIEEVKKYGDKLNTIYDDGKAHVLSKVS